MEKPAKSRQISKKDWIKWIVPVVLSVLIMVFTSFPALIEWGYSTGIYPYIAIVFRVITGWIPVSIGDFLYMILAIYLGYKVVSTLVKAIRRKITKQNTIRRTFKFARFLLWVYIVFNMAWGLNYHRKGLDHQLQLPVGRYSSSEVKALLDEVVIRLNENRRLISVDTVLPEQGFAQLKEGAVQSYQLATNRFPFLEYQMPSVKKTIYSGWAQYMGFTGYYNPFSGEAQLRTHLPEVMKPFIICHEIGHQIGYAKEFEASFAGYLAAASSGDPYFRYSVYLDMYNSIRTKLVYVGFDEGDTSILQEVLPQYNLKLDTLVRYDRRKMREYFAKNQTTFSEQTSSIVLGMYEQYLKANSQAAGLKSYDDVVSLLIAYRRKYGRI